jgi:hypothetical protein
MTRKYEATGPEAEFEPGSRERVLRNLLGITRVRDMNEAESQALVHATLERDYGPLSAMFARVIARSRRRAASSKQ